MPLLTAAEVQARGVGVDMDAGDLQDLIDAEEALMIAKYGAHGDGVSSVTEIVRRTRNGVFLKRPIVSVTTVTTAAYPGATASTLLAANYYTWLAEGRIELFPGGVLWETDDREIVTVTYVPIDDRGIRKQVLLELLRIATMQPLTGAGKVSGLGYSIEGNTTAAQDWDAARVRAYQRLGFFEV